jgi:hypothetical protein
MSHQLSESARREYREYISTRTKDRMDALRHEGRFLVHVPYGQRLTADGKHLEPEPREAAALEIIRKSTAKHDEALAKRDAIDQQIASLGHKDRAALRELRKAHRELTKTKKAEGSANLARRLKAVGKNAPPRSQWSTATVDAIRERFRKTENKKGKP